MKKMLLLVVILLSINLHADLVEDGLKEYKKSNYKAAIHLWDEACSGGDMQGCYNLGYIYAVEKSNYYNLQKALAFYEKACKMGNGDACKKYSRLIEEGVK